MSEDWHMLANADEIPSPALLIYPDRVEENIRRMIAMAGTADRLRPHVKTHKLGEIVQLQLKAGITRFKCATIAEAEMLAQAGARDVLLANQLVGPNARRLAKLAGWFREVCFSTIADDAEAVGNLASAGQEAGITMPVLLDLDGAWGAPASRLARRLSHSISSLTSCPASNRPGCTCTTGICTTVTRPSAWPSGRR